MISGAIDWIARAAAAAAQALALRSLKDGPLHLTAGGTVDAITAPFPAGITALEDMMAFCFESAGANTGAVTLNIGGTGAKPVVLIGGAAMTANDIPGARTLVEVFYTAADDHYNAQLIRQPSTVTPARATLAGLVGTSTRYARADHEHPSEATGRTDAGLTGAGLVGEYVEGVVLGASAVALTSNVSADVVSINLGPGRWRLSGGVYHLTDAATTYTAISGNWSTVSAALDIPKGYMIRTNALTIGSVSQIGAPVKSEVVFLAAPTTIYLCARAVFSAGTMKAFGEISAERID